MFTRVHLIATVSVMTLLASPVSAADSLPSEPSVIGANAETDDPAQEKSQNATSEQKDAAKEKMKEKWQSATPEQKAAMKEKMKERYQNATPEQQEKMRERLRERRQQRTQ